MRIEYHDNSTYPANEPNRKNSVEIHCAYDISPTEKQMEEETEIECDIEKRTAFKGHIQPGLTEFL
jgi:hypothetical protein